MYEQQTVRGHFCEFSVLPWAVFVTVRSGFIIESLRSAARDGSVIALSVHILSYSVPSLQAVTTVIEKLANADSLRRVQAPPTTTILRSLNRHTAEGERTDRWMGRQSLPHEVYLY